MIWSWQGPYEAALREKDPGRLPARLIVAEKAIFHRLQELPDGADELPEVQALREALNRLYALFPKERYVPGQIEDDADPIRRNWMRLAIPVGLSLMLAFAIALAMARRSERDDAQRTAAAGQKQLVRDPRTSAIGVRPDNTRPNNTAPDNYVPRILAESSAPDARPDPRASAKNREDAQKKDTKFPTEAAARERSDAAVARPLGKTPESGAPVPAVPFENTVAQESAGNAAGSSGGNSGAQAEEQSQGPAAGALAQEKPEPPRGFVTVSASAYPSIRVPPELKAASASGASFQIGELISRIDPIYPEEAERQHIEGSVKLRAIVGKDGAVQDVEVISGPPLLTPAAVGTIRQWRYTPTLLGDQAIEVADDITVVFRLADATALTNRP